MNSTETAKPTESIKTLIEKSKDYLETKIELTKLKTVNTASDVLSSMIAMISMIFFASLVIIFISIALALMIGKALGAIHYGFFIVGGFYAILSLIIYLQKNNWIKTPIANGLINKMLK